MSELKKNTSATYFPCFVMKLRAELGGENIEHAFTAKWHQLEEAFYNAIGKEHNVSRMSNFFAKDYSHFDSKPMELIIFDVNTHVDKRKSPGNNHSSPHDKVWHNFPNCGESSS